MKYKINALSILVLFLFVCNASIWAGSEAEYKKLSKSWTLNPDGSQEFHYSMELTLHTHTAMRSMYGETFITYNPDYQTLTVNASYTKQKDGTIVKTPDNAFVKVLPRSAANAPAYNHLTEMVVVHTGLELGATIYLDYTLTSKAGYLPALDILETIPQRSPVKEYDLSISVPQGSELSYGLVNPAAEAKVSTADGMQTVAWTLKNVKALSHAPMMHLYDGDVQYLTASSYGSEAEAVKGLYEQMEMRESMPLLSLAETVTEGKTSDTGKLQAILTFVNRDFGHSPLSLEETGYRMRHVEEVINSAYGTEAELTDLLQGLLNALKIPAEVCAVFPANDAPEDSYGLKGARLFVRAVADGRTYLLNAASDKMDAAGWLADRCRVVSLKTDKPVELPAADAAIRCTVAMQIDSTTVTSVMKSDIAEALCSYTKAAEEETTATDRLILTNGYAVVNLPEPAAGAATKRYAAWNTTRDRNLVLPYAPDESYTYTLDIPEGMTLCMPTDGYTLTNAAGSMSFSLKQTGNKLEVKRSLKVNSRLIKKADYPAFHALMAAWANPKQKSVIVYID